MPRIKQLGFVFPDEVMLPLRDQHLVKEDEPLLRMPVGQRLSEARLEIMCAQNKTCLGSASPGFEPCVAYAARPYPVARRGQQYLRLIVDAVHLQVRAGAVHLQVRVGAVHL